MRALATIITMLVSGILAQAQSANPDPTGPSEQPRHGWFGDLNLGISNYGMAGGLKVYYRTGNTFFSAGYYRSHLCCAGDYDGVPFWSSGAADHHVGVHSCSVGYGFMLPSKVKQGISAGISISKITDELTDPIQNDFSIGGLYREIVGAGFEEHSHGSSSKFVVGIPIEYTVFLFTKGSIGLDLDARIDLNTTRIFSAITLGLRIGK